MPNSQPFPVSPISTLLQVIAWLMIVASVLAILIGSFNAVYFSDVVPVLAGALGGFFGSMLFFALAAGLRKLCEIEYHLRERPASDPTIDR